MALWRRGDAATWLLLKLKLVEYAERHGVRDPREQPVAVWRMIALNRVTIQVRVYDRPKVRVRLILRVTYTPENMVYCI